MIAKIKLIIKKFLHLIIIKPLTFILTSIGQDKNLRDVNIHSILWNEAIEDSANYAKKYISEVMVFNNTQNLWDYLILKIKHSNKNTILEFGCYDAGSLNYFASKLPNKKFYGFDSFQGLPSDWLGHHASKGTFNLNSNLPKVLDNVELISGWFEESLPEFFSSHNELDVELIHIDSDTYNSAKSVLNNTKKFFKPGLFVLFDEYFGYPNWKNGEFLAWQEFCSDHSINYKYIAFASEQALIQIIK